MRNCTKCSFQKRLYKKTAGEPAVVRWWAWVVYFNLFSERKFPVAEKIACQRSAPSQNFILYIFPSSRCHSISPPAVQYFAVKALLTAAGTLAAEMLLPLAEIESLVPGTKSFTCVQELIVVSRSIASRSSFILVVFFEWWIKEQDKTRCLLGREQLNFTEQEFSAGKRVWNGFRPILSTIELAYIF